jgi:uncharacterized phage protein (TIGR01671 family)
MRELKFRAWDKYRGEKGVMLKNHTFSSIAATGLGYLEGLIWMQFTGLYDKNGKEIYEGDIIEFTDKWEWYRREWASKFWFADTEQTEKLLKEYHALPTEKMAVSFDMSEGVNFSVNDLEQGRWEVIGNIHENPELLTNQVNHD